MKEFITKIEGTAAAGIIALEYSQKKHRRPPVPAEMCRMDMEAILMSSR
jgi:hypothetical protein